MFYLLVYFYTAYNIWAGPDQTHNSELHLGLLQVQVHGPGTGPLPAVSFVYSSN